MHTEAFSGGISESGYYIVFHNFSVFITLVSFYFERTLWSVLDSIVVIDSLVVE